MKKKRNIVRLMVQCMTEKLNMFSVNNTQGVVILMKIIILYKKKGKRTTHDAYARLYGETKSEREFSDVVVT